MPRKWARFFQAPTQAIGREDSRIQLEHLGTKHLQPSDSVGYNTANTSSTSDSASNRAHPHGRSLRSLQHNLTTSKAHGTTISGRHQPDSRSMAPKKTRIQRLQQASTASAELEPCRSRGGGGWKWFKRSPSTASSSSSTAWQSFTSLLFRRTNSSKVVPIPSQLSVIESEPDDGLAWQRSDSARNSNPKRKKTVFGRIGDSVFRNPALKRRESIVAEEEVDVPYANYFVIHPYSSFRWYWDLLMIALLIFTVVSIPVAIAFFYDGTGIVYFGLSCLIDSLFLIDIFLNFRTGLVSSDAAHRIILSKKEIAKHYLHGWFFIDLISSLPLDYIITASLGASYDAPSYLKASRALKFIRVTKLLTLLRLLRVTRVFRVFRRWEEVMNVNTAWLRMIKLVIMMLLMAHWSGCIQFLAAQLASFPEDSWVTINGLVGSPVSVQYTWALFKALSHMLCIGYGRFPPRSIAEIWLTIFSMMIGATFYAVFIGQISTITLSIDSSGRVYREKLKEVAEYLRARKVPKDIRTRVFDYYEYRWAQRKYFDETQLLEEVSPGLRAEIIKHNCEPLVESLPFLRNADPNLIEAVTTRARFQVVMPGEFIIKANTFGAELFLLQYGVVEVVMPSGEIVAHLEDGSYFGEMGVVHTAKRAASVRAKTACKLYVLSQNKLREVEKEFPHLRSQLEYKAKKRMYRLHTLEPDAPNERPLLGSFHDSDDSADEGGSDDTGPDYQFIEGYARDKRDAQDDEPANGVHMSAEKKDTDDTLLVPRPTGSQKLRTRPSLAFGSMRDSDGIEFVYPSTASEQHSSRGIDRHATSDRARDPPAEKVCFQLPRPSSAASEGHNHRDRRAFMRDGATLCISEEEEEEEERGDEEGNASEKASTRDGAVGDDADHNQGLGQGLRKGSEVGHSSTRANDVSKSFLNARPPRVPTARKDTAGQVMRDTSAEERGRGAKISLASQRTKASVISTTDERNEFRLSTSDGALTYGGRRAASVMHPRRVWKNKPMRSSRETHDAQPTASTAPTTTSATRTNADSDRFLEQPAVHK